MSYDLVVLAAGMGSRFGGLKQVAPVGPNGELIIEYSMYDARRGGFDRAVFVIRRDIEKDFRAAVGRRLEARMDVSYVHQELADLPAPHGPPPGRTKPWGTGQAVIAAEPAVRRPFAVINADDFYGASAYRTLADYFRGAVNPSYALVGYVLRQTLSDHGGVNRGLCAADAAGRLIDIKETLKIERTPDGGARHPGADGTWVRLTGDEIVSMTFFGFTPAVFGQLQERFGRFLAEHGHDEKAEFLLPTALGDITRAGLAEMRLLRSGDQWFGVTYREDLPATRAAIQRLIAAGAYPEKL